MKYELKIGNAASTNLVSQFRHIFKSRSYQKFHDYFQLSQFSMTFSRFHDRVINPVITPLVIIISVSGV